MKNPKNLFLNIPRVNFEYLIEYLIEYPILPLALFIAPINQPSMKNCLICNKEIGNGAEVCNSCIEFFKWKYKKKHLHRIKRFKKEKLKLNLTGGKK
jgi:hypothetical protein